MRARWFALCLCGQQAVTIEMVNNHNIDGVRHIWVDVPDIIICEELKQPSKQKGKRQ